MCILAGMELLFPTLMGVGAPAGAAVASLTGATAAAGAAGAAAGAASGFGGLGTLFSIGSTLFGAISSYQQAQAAQQTAENNAMVAEWQAQDAIKRGDYDAAQIRRRASALKSTQRAEMAAKGLDLSYGTAADIQDQTDFFSETDVATVRTNAANEAWARRAQKANYQIQAASNNPWMAAGASLISGAGKVADRWYTYSNPSQSNSSSFFRTVAA